MTTEKKILLENTYQRFINEGLNPLNMDSIEEIVDPGIMGFGTTIDEKVFSLKDLREMLQRQKEQSEGFEIEFNIQPLYRFIAEDENIAAFADDLFLKVVMPDTNVDMYLRFTTIYEYKQDKWLAVHFHGSKPENVLSKEDTWGLETWKQKANELETIVAERTATLLEKSRELEIEASLERVRTAAMAMQVPEDLLKICERLFKELQAVGFQKLRNALIHTFNDEEKYFTDYDYSDFNGGYISRIPYSGHPAIDKFIKEVRSRSDAFTEISITGKELEDWREFRKANKEAPDARLEEAGTLYYYFYSVGPADIGISTFASISVLERELLKRFRNVFDLAYRRYLDIEQAMAQAREAQIEVALERVRSRTMAMHKSEELSETATVLFQQFKQLGETPGQVSIGIVNETEQVIDMWVSMMENPKNPSVKVSIHEPIVVQKIYNAWKEQKKSLIIDLSGNELKEYIQFRRSLGTLQIDNELLHGRRVTNVAFFSKGIIALSAPEHRPADTIKLLERFANVFDQAYTRFLDLQKAEAQAREAQIEAALERVRSRTMAMHTSEEVMDVAGTLFEEFQKLGFKFGASSIIIMNEETGDAEYWIAGFSKNKFPESYSVKYFQHPYHDQLLSAWKKGEKFLIYKLEGKEKQAYDEVLFSETGYRNIPDEEKVLMKGIPSVTFSIAFMKHGAIHWGPSHLTEEQANVLQRFAQVFDQTYTRFLDLQKAEAQAREAQIEVAVERVRAKALAMHKSEDLYSVVVTLKKELFGLNTDGVTAVSMYLEQDDGRIRALDLSSPTSGEEEESAFKMDFVFSLDDTDPDLWIRRIWNGTEHYFIVEADENDFKRIIHWLYTIDEKKAVVAERIINEEGIKKAWLPTVKLEKGKLNIDVLEPPTKEIESILVKIGAAFDLAYKRFLDLQKAEAQAREAQIELSLERIRARVTAMQRSVDLLDIVVTMRREFVSLGHEAHYFWHMRWQPGTYEKAMTSGDGTRIGMVMELPRGFHNIAAMTAWENNSEPYAVFALDVDSAIDYVDRMVKTARFSEIDPNAPGADAIRSIGGLTFVMARTTHGEIGYSLPGVVANPPAEDVATLVRFAAVFDLAYRRFEDLQSSEKRIREAQIELAIERVRAKTMSMQTSRELAEAASLLFHQVKALGIDVYSAGFTIWDEESENLVSWACNADGSMNPPFPMPYKENDWHHQQYQSWKNGEDFIAKDLNGEVMMSYFQYLRSFPLLDEAFKTSIAAGHPMPERQVHNVVNFSHGNLLFITYVPVAEAHDIFKRFAKVFEQTYTRFLDLQKAEAQALRAEKDLVEIKAARKKAEKALTELRATQKQLIQSEKMASLGELTAGIAHEIQNPLNFVNNFSEVSKELLDEMKDALEHGDAAEAKELAADIIQNLEKITHHGKRADSIVKGMLQHSRASSSQQELTDINALTDEYLRLAYHGLRAKDKSFNAILKTDFDESLGKVSIVPQDIGRAVLNLITNAFHAVTEKKKATPENFEPTVSVSTKKRGDSIELTVADNGNGIPQNIIDKIFQPFFTTKPTGQGTGLGLSLAYDIVKAHNGDLIVDTKAGAGSVFVVRLPV